MEGPGVLGEHARTGRSPGCPARERGDDLRVRGSAPVTGHDLPITLFAHGFGSNPDGYAPLTDYWPPTASW